MSNFTIITVTYNSEKTINECLDSVIKYLPNAEIIVVDNGSSDSTLNIVKKFGKQIKLIETGKNLGFAKANNLGAKEAASEYLVFLNPDAMFTQPQSLEALRKSLDEGLKYGIVGPKLIYPDGTIQPRVRNLPTVSRAFMEYILGIKGSYAFYEPKCLGVCEVESISGACMMIKKELFERVGGFDEKYFMYYEDIEICKSIKQMGYKVGFVPDVKVEHAEGISGQNHETHELMKRSAKKYFGPIVYYLLELIFFYNRLMNKMRKAIGKQLHV